MSMNQRYKDGFSVDIPVPSGVTAGDYVVVGHIKGVANIDRQDDGTASVWRIGSFLFDAKAAVAAGASSQIVVGDPIYYNAAGTPKFTKDPAGVYVGTSLTVMAGGATGKVEVLLNPDRMS